MVISPVNSDTINYPRVPGKPGQPAPMARTKYSLVETHERQSSRSWHTLASAFQLQALSASICLATFLCFTVSFASGGPVGTTELFSGQCSHAVNINRVLQALLALIAIGVSVSSDFFMRLASSPTVADLREAHSQGRSLDIAVHSLRNVRHMSYWRTFGWITLILLAVPIQLFSHSIAFISFSTTAYSRLSVSEAFTTGQPFGYPGVALWNTPLTKSPRSQFHDILPLFQSASTTWDRLELSDCNRIYSQDLEGLQSHRNLLVVIETAPDPDAKGWTLPQVWDGSREWDPFNGYDYKLENSLWSFATFCEVDRVGYYNNGGYTRCGFSRGNDNGSGLIAPEPWGDSAIINISSISVLSSKVHDWDMREIFQTPRAKYCLSEPYSAPCKVYVSNLFLLITTLCIFLGCTCSMVVTHFCWHKETCQSLGDALQAFLTDGEAFVQLPREFAAVCNPEGAASYSTRWMPVTKWKEARPRWGQAASKRMWILTYAPIGVLLLGGSAALGALGKSISQVPDPLLSNTQI